MNLFRFCFCLPCMFSMRLYIYSLFHFQWKRCLTFSSIKRFKENYLKFKCAWDCCNLLTLHFYGFFSLGSSNIIVSVNTKPPTAFSTLFLQIQRRTDHNFQPQHEITKPSLFSLFQCKCLSISLKLSVCLSVAVCLWL